MIKKSKSLFFAIALLLVLIPVVGLNTKGSGVVKAAMSNSQTEAVSKAILVELNNLRGQNSLSSVSGNYVLTDMAQKRADHLADIGSLDGHTGYNYQNGAPYTAVAGENIGYWYNSAVNDPTQIAKQIIEQLYVDSGIADLGHRKNMLNPYFQHVGIGVSINPSDGYIYYAQDFGSTSTELGSNYSGASAYSNYTHQIVTSLKYPSSYDPQFDTSTKDLPITIEAKRVNAVITTNRLTPLYTSPMGKKTSRSLAFNTAWYTDAVYTDNYGNNWYHVSTSEWAPINGSNLRNITN